MSTVNITIEGTTPLIQNRDLVYPKMKDLDDWKEYLYLDESELLYQPAVDLLECIAKVRKIDGLTIKEQHILFEGLLIEKIDGDDQKPIYLKGNTPVINTGWRFSFTINVENYTHALWVKDVLKEAGRCIGIGGFTPKYGRFKVVELKIEG